MSKQITAADLQSPETPGDGWYIIEAAGEYPSRLGDITYTQSLTPETLQAVADAGVPQEGLPIDRDHLSYNPANSTEALGWVRELATCQGNLAARIEWTALGQPLIRGHVYKHFSTVYPPAAEQIIAGAYTPTHLVGLALTNQPHNRTGQPPITNRELPTPPQTQQQKTMNPDILAKLGMAEGATDEEIAAAIDALQQELADAKSCVANAEQKEAESMVAAEEAAADVKLDDEERKEAADHIITNRDHGLKFLRLLCNSKRPPAAEPQPASRLYADKSTPEAREQLVFNRAKQPDARQLILNRANEICREARNRGEHKPFTLAKREAEREAALQHV